MNVDVIFGGEVFRPSLLGLLRNPHPSMGILKITGRTFSHFIFRHYCQLNILSIDPQQGTNGGLTCEWVSNVIEPVSKSLRWPDSDDSSSALSSSSSLSSSPSLKWFWTTCVKPSQTNNIQNDPRGFGFRKNVQSTLSGVRTIRAWIHLGSRILSHTFQNHNKVFLWSVLNEFGSFVFT